MNHVSSSLDGTKTLENLRQAFLKEAEAFAKNRIYAELANKDGDYSSYRALDEMSENDKRHAELWLGYLDELGDAFENLSEMADLANSMRDDIYPVMAEIAGEEGFEEIAEKMRLVSDVKNRHINMLEDKAKRVSSDDAFYRTDPETVWLCGSCGYSVKGNTPPERCPLCSYPVTFFETTDL